MSGLLAGRTAMIYRGRPTSVSVSWSPRIIPYARVRNLSEAFAKGDDLGMYVHFRRGGAYFRLIFLPPRLELLLSWPGLLELVLHMMLDEWMLWKRKKNELGTIQAGPATWSSTSHPPLSLGHPPGTQFFSSSQRHRRNDKLNTHHKVPVITAQDVATRLDMLGVAPSGACSVIL